jgi:head-tail adaptor
MIAGNLRHIIVVQRLSIIKDAYGAPTETYNTTHTLKAELQSASGGKGVNNEEIFNSVQLNFITYYRDILESDRIIYKSKNYKILSIVEIGYKEGLRITVEKINE